MPAKKSAKKAKIKFNGLESTAEPGTIEMHFGYKCEVQEDGSLVAEVDAELAKVETDANRAEVVE